jgi:DNA invertase Pin-like site-specific DNA recombinase
MAQIGYARVSRRTQNLALQTTALGEAGCARIFQEKASGALARRPELDALLEYLRPGDVLVVWKLDRLGRSLRHLVDVVTTLAERGVGFRSLTEQLDTTTPGGRLIFHVFAAIAEFERDLIRERTQEGLDTARAQGRTGGRPVVMTSEKIALARRMLDEGQRPTDVARALSVSRGSVYRHCIPHQEAA